MWHLRAHNSLQVTQHLAERLGGLLVAGAGDAGGALTMHVVVHWQPVVRTMMPRARTLPMLLLCRCQPVGGASTCRHTGGPQWTGCTHGSATGRQHGKPCCCCSFCVPCRANFGFCNCLTALLVCHVLNLESAPPGVCRLMAGPAVLATLLVAIISMHLACWCGPLPAGAHMA